MTKDTTAVSAVVSTFVTNSSTNSKRNLPVHITSYRFCSHSTSLMMFALQSVCFLCSIWFHFTFTWCTFTFGYANLIWTLNFSTLVCSYVSCYFPFVFLLCNKICLHLHPSGNIDLLVVFFLFLLHGCVVGWTFVHGFINVRRWQFTECLFFPNPLFPSNLVRETD